MNQDFFDVRAVDRRLSHGLRRVLFLTACAFMLVSCEAFDAAAPGDGESPSTPANPISPSAPRFPGGTPDTTGTPPDTLPPDPALDSTLAAERARITLRATTSEAEYQSLQLVWLDIEQGRIPAPVSPLLQCEPQQYAGDAQIIGPLGGILRTGNHVLRIPAGAVRNRTVITAEADPSLDVGVRFLPAGITFDRPLELELNYQHCNLSLFRPAFRGAYVDDQGTVLEYPSSADDKSGERLTIFVDHFSKYAVAY
jgi:hypothetical protein